MTMTIKSQVYTNLSFQAELVEETIHEFLPLLSSGDIIIDHGTATLKILRRKQSGWKSLVSNILTVVLLVEFMVWSVDIVLWLVVQILQYPSVLLSSALFTRFICFTDPMSRATS